MLPRPPKPTLFPYTTLFRSGSIASGGAVPPVRWDPGTSPAGCPRFLSTRDADRVARAMRSVVTSGTGRALRSQDRKSTRLNSSHVEISYAVFCLKKKKRGLINRLRRESAARCQETRFYQRRIFFVADHGTASFNAMSSRLAMPRSYVNG